jgi:hypothetical protein
MTGIARARQTAPKIAPTKELIRAAPSARPASPFFAMGWPSTIVAAVVGSPGTPKRMEVISPVVPVTADMPRRKAKASTGDILKIKGSIKANVVGPPSPGRMPTIKPTATPIIIRLKVDQLKTCSRPESKALINSIIGLYPPPLS